MSFVVKSSQLGYLSNKEREDFFLSDDEDADFNFKYVPANRFKNVVKNVRRQKSKMDEERVWASFVRQQELQMPSNASDNYNPMTIHNMKRFLHDGIQEVDRELKRLEEDAMPEMSERPYKGIVGMKKQDSQLMPRKMVQEEPERKAPVMKDSGTGSTNFLITIPEEENMTSSTKHSSKQKCRLRTNTRKSASDHTMIKRNHCRKLLHVMDDSEYNSSPEASPDRISEKEEDIYARLDPVMAQKIFAMQKKVSMLLDEISFRLDRIPLPDGDRDLLRRQQRVVEFSIRFSRNYLYDLGRQVTEIQRHVRAISLNARPKPTRRGVIFHMQVIGQKLITSHQMLLQALGAYCKHIPSSVVRGHPGKLKEILQVVMNLEDICTEVNVTSNHFGSGDADMQPAGKETQRKCSVILSKLQLRNLGSDNDSQLVSHTTQSTLVPPPPSAESKKRNERKRLSSRLSMYSMESNLSKNHLSRRPNSSFHRGKKYTATSSKFDNYSAKPQQPNPGPATNKSSKGTLLNAALRVKLPPREDDIRTMMDTMPADSDLASSIEALPNSKCYNANSLNQKSRISHEQITGKKIPSKSKSCRDPQEPNNDEIIVNDQELTEKVSMITDEHLSSLVPVIAELMSLVTDKQNDFKIRPVSSASMETLLGFLRKYQFPQNSSNKQVSDKPNKFRSTQNPHIKQVYHEDDSPKETRTGAKNMQLINLPSKEEKEEQLKSSDVFCQANYWNSCETLNSYSELTNKEACKPGVREQSGVHLVAPMASNNLIAEYQEKYRAFTQSSPMYLSNTHNKPWDVVTWIADKLVDELVVHISKELQMDNVIKRMFDLEFQEF